jgi:hypothetical protein
MFASPLEMGIPRNDIRLEKKLLLKGINNSDNFALPLWQHPENAFINFLGILGVLYPLALHYVGEHVLKLMQRSKSKAKVPFFWSAVSLAPTFIVYMTIKLLLVACHPRRIKSSVAVNVMAVCFLLSYILLTISIVAYNHSQYLSLPIPRTWSLFIKCKGREKRILKAISLWVIYVSVAGLVGCMLFQLLLVSVNPHFYGFTIITVWCAMLGCIVVVAIPFTIDQVFIADKEYKITPKQACRQSVVLLLMVFLTLGLGSQALSIALILHLSKYGEKTQSVSTFVRFILQHVFMPAGVWILKAIVKNLKARSEEVLDKLIHA